MLHIYDPWARRDGLLRRKELGLLGIEFIARATEIRQLPLAKRPCLIDQVAVRLQLFGLRFHLSCHTCWRNPYQAPLPMANTTNFMSHAANAAQLQSQEDVVMQVAMGQ